MTINLSDLQNIQDTLIDLYNELNRINDFNFNIISKLDPSNYVTVLEQLNKRTNAILQQITNYDLELTRLRSKLYD